MTVLLLFSTYYNITFHDFFRHTILWLFTMTFFTYYNMTFLLFRHTILWLFFNIIYYDFFDFFRHTILWHFSTYYTMTLFYVLYCDFLISYYTNKEGMQHSNNLFWNIYLQKTKHMSHNLFDILYSDFSWLFSTYYTMTF